MADVCGAIWIQFDQPAWLWAGCFALLPLAVGLWNRRRGRGVRRSVVAMQCFSLLLAATALARPRLSTAGREPTWLLLRDVSASVGEQADQPFPLPADVRAKSQPFAGRLLGADEQDERDATRLGQALAWATAKCNADQADGVILVTDGRFQDDWHQAARRYVRARAPLYIVPLDAPPRDARVVAFTAQRRNSRESLRLVATYNLSITVVANAAMRRVLRVYRTPPGRPRRELARNEIALEPNRPVTIHLSDTLPRDAVGLWEAQLTPPDALPQNDTRKAAYFPATRSVAWVSRKAIPPILFRKFEITVLPASDAPTTSVGWMQYAAVVLADATGTLLRPKLRAALAEYVRGGGGLVLLGAGPHGSPGDRDDPLNRVLPLVADPFERSPLDLTVVLDASGSMAEVSDTPARTKWSLASEAVLALREHLTPADKLRVIVFADAAHTIYDSGAAAPDFVAIGDALRAVTPAGPTNIAPALERCSGGLADLRSAAKQKDADKQKLVLVLSDLQTSAFDSAAMAKRFRSQNLRLAVVATGATDAGKTPLAQLAKRLDAPLVYRQHLQGLAETFGRLCRRARGPAIRKGSFRVVYRKNVDKSRTSTPSGRHRGTASQVGDRIQKISAYIPSAVKSWARVLARIQQTGDAFLAIGSAGLGRCAVFATPPEEIRNQPTFPATLTDMLKRTVRKTNDPRFGLQAVREHRSLQLRVTARMGGKSINNLSLRAEVQGLTGAEPIEAVKLEQSAPGLYEAEISDIAAASNPLAVRVYDEATNRIVWQNRVPAWLGAEYVHLGADYDALRELATLTDGRIVQSGAMTSPEMREKLTQPQRAGKNVWFIPLVAAIVLMLLAWRRGSLGKRQ